MTEAVQALLDRYRNALRQVDLAQQQLGEATAALYRAGLFPVMLYDPHTLINQGADDATTNGSASPCSGGDP